MTKGELLKASIKEFEDLTNNALFWECKKVFTDSGYCFIIQKTSRPISCAIHFARSFETSEEIGKYENIDVAINTREELDFSGIITYKDFVIGLLSQGNYNETSKQFHYRGVGSFTPISSKFLVKSEAEIDANIGVNAMPIFLKFGGRYPYVPSYFEASSHKQYVMVDCDDDGSIGNGIFADDADKYALHKSANIKLTFVNFGRDEALAELHRIQQHSLRDDAEFGFMSPPTLDNKYSYQLAFNWKSLTYVSEFKINYCVRSDSSAYISKVREVLFESIEAL